jgi:hypothetical protein
LSSLLDVPAQLALILSLVAANGNDLAPRVPVAALASAPATATIAAEPLEGPYRFGEGTWLRALKEDLPGGTSGYARSIFRTSGGRYYVPRQDERRQILSARDDEALAARAARAFAQANARVLSARLSRAPTAGELYMAHVFGPEAAASLIARVRSSPGEPAAKHVPELARTAKDLFGARPATFTLAELYAKLTARLAGAQAEARSAKRSSSLMASMLQSGPTWDALRSNAVAWQTEVSAGTSVAPPQ